MLSETAPFLRDPLIKKPSGTTDKTHDHNDYPPYHIPHQKHTVSYFTSLTLISKPLTFLTRGGGIRVLRQRTSVLQRKRRRRRRGRGRQRRSYHDERTRGRAYHHAIIIYIEVTLCGPRRF
jgi:hypothetical protein